MCGSEYLGGLDCLVEFVLSFNISARIFSRVSEVVENCGKGNDTLDEIHAFADTVAIQSLSSFARRRCILFLSSLL
jgi:hypothetical protein